MLPNYWLMAGCWWEMNKVTHVSNPKLMHMELYGSVCRMEPYQNSVFLFTFMQCFMARTVSHHAFGKRSAYSYLFLSQRSVCGVRVCYWEEMWAISGCLQSALLDRRSCYQTLSTAQELNRVALVRLKGINVSFRKKLYARSTDPRSVSFHPCDY